MLLEYPVPYKVSKQQAKYLRQHCVMVCTEPKPTKEHIVKQLFYQQCDLMIRLLLSCRSTYDKTSLLTTHSPHTSRCYKNNICEFPLTLCVLVPRLSTYYRIKDCITLPPSKYHVLYQTTRQVDLCPG